MRTATSAFFLLLVLPLLLAGAVGTTAPPVSPPAAPPVAPVLVTPTEKPVLSVAPAPEVAPAVVTPTRRFGGITLGGGRPGLGMLMRQAR